jgi:hypothetical protein
MIAVWILTREKHSRPNPLIKTDFEEKRKRVYGTETHHLFVDFRLLIGKSCV